MRYIEIIPQSTNSILVVNPQGHMRELFCPFRVCCIKAVDNIRVNSWIWVDKVSFASNVKLLYQIHGNLYQYSHFAIQISF